MRSPVCSPARKILVLGVSLVLLAAMASAQTGSKDAKDRTPAPKAVDISKAEKTIKSLFAAEYAKKKPADLIAFSRMLLKEGLSTADDPPGQYVLLRDARD